MSQKLLRNPQTGSGFQGCFLDRFIASRAWNLRRSRDAKKAKQPAPKLLVKDEGKIPGRLVVVYAPYSSTGGWQFSSQPVIEIVFLPVMAQRFWQMAMVYRLDFNDLVGSKVFSALMKLPVIMLIFATFRQKINVLQFGILQVFS
jgi:hypothetical protein